MSIVYDCIVVGAGPAGLTASIYLRRQGKTVLLVEESAFGGQMTFSPKIENYPGFDSVSGNELAEKMLDQATGLGVEIEAGKVLEILDGEKKTVKTDFDTFLSRAVIIAIGAKHRRLNVPGENLSGVSYCAVCDGAFAKDRDVVVVGGGNSALQEIILLSEICKSVTVIQDLPTLTGEKSSIDKINSLENVTVLTDCSVKEIIGRDNVSGISIEQNGMEKKVECEFVFVAIGLEPKNDDFKSLCELDKCGYFDSDESTVTRTNGIFVAGDCRKKAVRQISTACGDGASAAIAVCKYLQ